MAQLDIHWYPILSRFDNLNESAFDQVAKLIKLEEFIKISKLIGNIRSTKAIKPYISKKVDIQEYYEEAFKAPEGVKVPLGLLTKYIAV